MLHLTAKNFDSETKNNALPVIVMFYADWCNKCAMMKPLAEEIAGRYRKTILFCEVNVDESPLLSQQYSADIVPSFVFFQDGKLLRTIQGTFSEYTFEKQIQKIFRNC